MSQSLLFEVSIPSGKPVKAIKANAGSQSLLFEVSIPSKRVNNFNPPAMSQSLLFEVSIPSKGGFKHFELLDDVAIPSF